MQTANVRFKLRIFQNRKWADKNSLKQFLRVKIARTTNLCVEIIKCKRQVMGRLGHVVQLAFAVWREHDA